MDRELRDADALSAEITVSALLGGALRAERDDPTVVPMTDLLPEIVRQAARSRRPTSLGLLRCLAVLGEPDERHIAEEGIRRLTEAGVEAPEWTIDLDDVAATGAWAVGDVYGDAATIAVEFSRPAPPHTLVVLVDHTHGGIAQGAFLEDDPGEARAIREEQERDPLVVAEELDLATARARIETALAAAGRVDLDDDLLATRALALSRLRALPAGTALRPEPLHDAGRDALVDAFLASPEAEELDSTPNVQGIGRLIVEHRIEAEPADPLRIGPGVLADLLLDRLPEAAWTGGEVAAVPDVVVAWARFAARRRGLPPAAVDHLLAAAEDLADAYRTADGAPGLLLGGRTEELLTSYAGDLLEAGADLATLYEAITRRTFAVPPGGATIDGEYFAHLDPADPDERALLIRGEHPEYAAALDDPFFEGEVDGVNPRLHVTFHEMVANQLWDDDPPETWRAAQRLLAAGMERHDVLHELAAVAAERLWHALSDKRPVDLDEYCAALDALDALPAKRPPSRGRRLSEEQQELFEPPAPTPLRPTVVRLTPRRKGTGRPNATQG